MARPQRNNVDYFPFICEEGKKMYYIEETYGNDGFAVFVKILRELAKTNYHYLDLNKSTTIMFLSAKCKVSKELLESIISDLVEMDKFDSVLWNDNRVIWCQDFIDSIQDAYAKRKNKCITYDGLIHHLMSLGVRKPPNNDLNGGINPQSIVEDSKLEETKEEDIEESPPPNLKDTSINNKNPFQIFNAKGLEEELFSSEIWIEKVCILTKMDKISIRNKIKEFILNLEAKDDIDKPLKDIKSHFVNWLRSNKDKPVNGKTSTTYKPPKNLIRYDR